MKKENALRKLLFLLLIPIVVFMYFFNKKRKENALDQKIDELKDENLQPAPVFASNGLNDRQMKILDYISEKGSGKVSEMVTFFAQTDRTLRRDLNKLEGLGFVKRSGSTKSVSYTLSK